MIGRSEYDEDTHRLLHCHEHGIYIPRYGRRGGTICPECPNMFIDMVSYIQSNLIREYEKGVWCA